MGVAAWEWGGDGGVEDGSSEEEEQGGRVASDV